FYMGGIPRGLSAPSIAVPKASKADTQPFPIWRSLHQKFHWNPKLSRCVGERSYVHLISKDVRCQIGDPACHRRKRSTRATHSIGGLLGRSLRNKLARAFENVTNSPQNFRLSCSR